jgi:RNA polymerase sigma-70 factor (ECF subfamily)
MTDDDLPALLDRLRAGDQAVAALVFHRFRHRLIGLARQHLHERLRAKLDPEDVLQSALNSFFCRFAEGQFQLDSWDSLWSLLVVITLRKCGAKVEYYRAGCRDVAREAAPPTTEESWASWQAVAREPSPTEGLLLAELVVTLMRSLKDERERRMLALSLQGYSTAEIAAEVGRTDRSVQRVLARVQAKLTALRDRDCEKP